MAIVLKNLARAQLSATAGTLVYSAPTSPARAAVVTSIRLVNRGTSSATVNLYVNTAPGISSFALIPAGLVIPPKYEVSDDTEVTLASGEGVYGDVSASGSVDIVLSGFERDVV